MWRPKSGKAGETLALGVGCRYCMNNRRWNSKELYRAWVMANSLAELAGLGLTFAVGFLCIRRLGEPSTPAGWVALLGAMTFSGAAEGAIVGFAQWRVLRHRLEIGRRSWMGATIAGALLAWLLGSLPSTLMQAGAEADSRAIEEPDLGLVLLFASAIGLAAGAVLASAQAVVLRKAVRRAGLWLPANSLAWAVGMPVIFLAIDLASRAGMLPLRVLGMAAGLAAAGAAVGAVHGLVLIRLEPLPASRDET